MSEPDTRFDPKDTPLLEIVFQRIEKSPSKAIPFSEFVELALYHPDYGYYSRPQSRPIGRAGDFYTSVSVGETFGFLLAEAIRRKRPEISGSPEFTLVEQGGHDGRLALDVLTALQSSCANEGIHYRAIEPRQQVRDGLNQRFVEAGFGDYALAVATTEEARVESGVFFCNELLDALPFALVVLREGEWREIFVEREGHSLVRKETVLRSELRVEVERIGTDFPEGYETEVRPALSTWTNEIATLFDRGEWWVIDYGFEREEYYAPSRTKGTWRCFRDHRASEDAFDAIGETDITAHVDFTRLREAAESAGLEWIGLRDQSRFLTSAARDWLLSLDGSPPLGKDAQRLRQFQSLTHPSLMGSRFHFAEMRKGFP